MASAVKPGLVARARELANNVPFRKGLRAARIVVLGVGAYKIGQYNGMRVITEDPDGFERSRFIKVLCEEAKRGNSTKYRVLHEREKVDPSYIHDLEMIDEHSDNHSFDLDATQARAVRKACPLTGAERVSLVKEDPNHPELFEYIEEGNAEFGDAMLQVHRVGSRVLDTARLMLEDELLLIAEAEENGVAAALFKSETTAASMIGASGRRVDGPFAGCTYSNLKKAQRLLGLTWDIVVLDSNSANAKQVYEQPRRLFVHAPLANEVCANEAELAMVLGNIVSHSIFGHEHEQQNIKQAVMSTQVVLLTMIDPTGIFTAFLEAAMLGAALGGVVESMVSAPQDIEADRVALNIVTDAGYDPREAIGLYQRLRRAEDLKREPGNHLEDAGVIAPGSQLQLGLGMLAPALFTIDRMRTIEARVEKMAELYESRKPLPETYSEFAARWYHHIMWRVNAEAEPNDAMHQKPRQAKVLARRVVLEDKEQFVEPVPGVLDAVGYVAALPVNYLLSPAYNWLIYPVYASVSQQVAGLIAGGGPVEGPHDYGGGGDVEEAMIVEVGGDGDDGEGEAVEATN